MKRILVFGTGDYYQKKKESIAGEIVGYVDNYKTGKFEGKNVYKVKDIETLSYDQIYIMAGENVFADMACQLLREGVNPEKIKFGQNILPLIGREPLYLGEDKKIIINKDNRLCYKTMFLEIAFSTYDELCGIQDIFGENTYEYFLDSSDNVVIDIGMNIGAASIFFAMRQDVCRVYSYEPFPATYQDAVKNFTYNSVYSKKIVPINAGLSDRPGYEELLYNSSMTCGMSTQKNFLSAAVDKYKNWGFYREEKEKTAKIHLLDAGKEIEKILAENPGKRFILKIDCEGSEYRIFERLDELGLVGRFSIIMLEWHYMGSFKLEEYLKKEAYTFFSFRKNDVMGLIYAIKK